MQIICPVKQCRKQNDGSAEKCTHCGAPLRNYIRLTSNSNQLFNYGLLAARAGHFFLALEYFSTIVHWNPSDLEACNALAMTYLSLNELQRAREYWEFVAKIAPDDEIASKGLTILAQREKTVESIDSRTQQKVTKGTKRQKKNKKR